MKSDSYVFSQKTILAIDIVPHLSKILNVLDYKHRVDFKIKKIKLFNFKN